GLAKLDRHRAHHESEARRLPLRFSEQRTLVGAQEAQIVGAPTLHEAQVVGVIDDAGEVGVLVIDPHRHDVAAVANLAVEVGLRAHDGASTFTALRGRARSCIQISAMITPGMVRLSWRTTWISGRSPVPSNAARASAFCANLAAQARRISSQCSKV